MLKLAPALVLTLVFAQPGLCEDALVDQWTEQFLALQKVGYAHDIVVKVNAHYVREDSDWWPTEGGMMHTQTRVETDAQGRVIRYEQTEKNALGVSRTSVVTKDGVLHWTARHREQPERKGVIKGAVYDSDMVALLVARGVRKPGELKLRVLDLPEGTKDKTYTAIRDKDQLHFSEEDSMTIFDAKGALVQGIQLDAAGAEAVPVTKAQAQDMTRKPTKAEPVEGLSPGVAKNLGITLSSPGKGWALVYMPSDADEKLSEGALMLLHPHDVVMMCIPMPVPLPAEPEALKLFAPQMEEGLNSDSNDVKFSNVKATKAWGFPALEFVAEGDFEGVLVKGRTWILRRNATQGLMVMLFSPSDKQKETAALVEAARKGLAVKPLVPAKAGKDQQAVFPGGLTLQLPSGWKRAKTKVRDSWSSPAGSYVAAWLEPTPGLAAKAVIENWTQSMAEQFGTAPGEVEAFKLGGRDLLRTVLSVEQKGVPMTVRLIVGEVTGNETFLMMAIDTSLEQKDALKKIFATAKWKTK